MGEVRRVAVVLDVALPHQRKLIRGIAAYARQAGGWQLYAEEELLDAIPDFRRWHGHGIITGFTNRRVAAIVQGSGLPVVGIEGGYDWYDARSGIPYVNTDNAAVARMAADHLLGLGHRRLAFCGLPASRHTAWAGERARAFRDHARAAGAQCDEYRGRHLTTRRWDALQQGLCAWLTALEKPVGIMGANDARARHVLEACRTLGLRVPDDVAVLGVDNDELMCDITTPPLSSVEQGVHAIGFQAAELLGRLMAGGKPPRLATVVPPERVVVRQSTDAVAVGDADVAAALRFIRGRIRDRIGVADVLGEVAVSRSTLEARFRDVLGCTIGAEIRRTMLDRAQVLIAGGEHTLKQVAHEAGFTHVQHMTNVFRRHLGRTPGEVRRAGRPGR